MGSIIEYRCAACTYASGELSVGWGKEGRASFWGGLARCTPCKKLGVVDLSRKYTGIGERSCDACGGGLTLFEGTFGSVPCPRCAKPLQPETHGRWS